MSKTSDEWLSAVVCGRSGSGKSELVDMLVRDWRIRNPKLPVIFIDPKNEHTNFSNGVRIVPNPDDTLLIDAPMLGMVDRWVGRAFERGNCLVVCDEMDLSVSGKPNGPAPLSPLRVVMHGRARNVSYVWVSRRPVELPPKWTTQANDIYIFSLRGRDLDFAKTEGADPNVVRGLQVGEFVHLDRTRVPHVHNNATSVCEM